jgi:hypothetical protein
LWRDKQMDNSVCLRLFLIALPRCLDACADSEEVEAIEYGGDGLAGSGESVGEGGRTGAGIEGL